MMPFFFLNFFCPITIVFYIITIPLTPYLLLSLSLSLSVCLSLSHPLSLSSYSLFLSLPLSLSLSLSLSCYLTHPLSMSLSLSHILFLSLTSFFPLIIFLSFRWRISVWLHQLLYQGWVSFIWNRGVSVWTFSCNRGLRNCQPLHQLL